MRAPSKGYFWQGSSNKGRVLRDLKTDALKEGFSTRLGHLVTSLSTIDLVTSILMKSREIKSIKKDLLHHLQISEEFEKSVIGINEKMGLKFVSERGEKEIKVRNVRIGKDFIIVAGPCAVESKEQLLNTAVFVKSKGAHLLRAMLFKPRTSPYSFQGLGIDGLRVVKEVKEEADMPVVTEVLDPRDVKKVCEIADVIQVGARNMQNFTLLKEVGRVDKPVILKRGISATMEEWLNAAEYIMSEGNSDVILCERGVRTFISETRFTLDLASIPIIKKLTHLPVIVDPSHAAGDSFLVKPLAKASKVVGSDGLMVEVHPNPKNALSDKKQQLDFNAFKQLMQELDDLK